ncbi:hypothetical protein RJ639_022276, partial [Escallonia herrerae]
MSSKSNELNHQDPGDIEGAKEGKEDFLLPRSAEFGHIVDISLKTIVDELMEDIKVQFAESNMILGMPLAKLLPRLGKMGLLEEPSRNRFIQIIRNLPEVDVFFTLLYANMSTS